MIQTIPLFLFFLRLLAAPAAEDASLVGRIELTGPDGKTVPAEGSVVWIPGVSVPSGANAPSLESRQKRFAPHVLAVSRGTDVSFPNLDPIYHNVFSRSEGNEFDLGLYRKGAARSVRLDKPGLVRIYCNIHPEMAAYVMVLPDAAFAVTGSDGTFQIADIPPGRRTVHVWHEKGGDKELVTAFQAGKRQTLDVVLDGSAFRPTPHKNKYGRDYPPVSQDDDRY